MTATTRQNGPGLLEGDPEVARLLALACAHLGMQAAFVSEITETPRIYRAVTGDGDAFGLVVDDGSPLDSTSCCLDQRPDPRLSDRDASFTSLLAEMLAERIDLLETERRNRDVVQDIVDDETVEVALQPIVSLTTGRWEGTEALARFPGCSLRVDEVFSLAIRIGLGPDLELLALRTALARLADMPPATYLSVDLSPTGIADPRCAALLAATPDLHRIVLEVTEHAPVEQYAGLLGVLSPLRAAGLRLAVDDVGAGYASFRHVLQLQPDILKIDSVLVDGIADDSALRSIVSSLVLLGLDLRASVTAEGVENRRDLQVLEELGVDNAQGYLYARPTTDASTWRLSSQGQPWGAAPSSPGMSAVLEQLATLLAAALSSCSAPYSTVGS